MAKKKKIEKKTSRTGLIVTGMALCIAVFVFWLASRGSDRWEVPDYLVGRWISFAPAYQDRYFDINKVSLIFATGPSTVSEYFISNIITTATDTETSFSIDTWDIQNISYQFFLVYQPDDHGGTLYFKNQPQVKWLKITS